MVTSFISSTPLLSNRSRHQVNRCARQIRVTPCATAVPRRDVLRLSAVIAASLAFPKLKGIAATMTKTAPELGEKIDSGVFGYAFSTPPDGWSKQIVTLSSARTATIFVRDKDGDSNINMVSTPVSGDFTKLSSFGSIDNVVNTIIPPKKKNIEGELISHSTDTAKNAYIFEYTVTSRGVKRHLITVFSLQPGRFIHTLTGQAKEETWPEVEPIVRAVTASYELKHMD